MQTRRMYSVVELSGYRIDQRKGMTKAGSGSRQATDYHVVDERGRTKRIFPCPVATNRWRENERAAAAQEYADQLNAALAREAVQTNKGTEA